MYVGIIVYNVLMHMKIYVFFQDVNIYVIFWYVTVLVFPSNEKPPDRDSYGGSDIDDRNIYSRIS